MFLVFLDFYLVLQLQVKIASIAEENLHDSVSMT